ncbi:MAG: sirohydrochlorin cobaltochelatase [Deltaproteobacteria bacterium]|nr:sirohydrochlorin cobaltochelatase [Deltaproteobacteria bacterium]
MLINVLFVLVAPFPVWAGGGGTAAREGAAIVLASFGTTVPEAVGSIINIKKRVEHAFPDTPVKITFTSNIVRSVWRKRQVDAQKWLDQGIPKEVLYVKNIVATIGDLLESGYKDIIVQPTHMFYMEQSYDLEQYVNALSGIRTMKAKWQPFGRLVMGRPALGRPGSVHDYCQDLEKAVAILEGDVRLARREAAMLVYMGHGNEHWPTGIYAEFAHQMHQLYPDVVTCVGVVEGFPGIDQVSDCLKAFKKGKVVLKPFMIVAGDHAMNDMAGDEADSWKSVLTRAGFDVMPVLEGLGSNDAFADIFVSHIKDAANDAGIALK